MTLLLLALLAAQAAPPTMPAADEGEPQTTRRAHWEAEPYWDRTLRVGGVYVGGNTSLQAIAGIEAGYRYGWTAAPHWVGRTRVALTGIYGISSGSYGGGVALGSFIGPNGKRVLLQSGPDLWVDGYGSPSAFDYYLAWTPGISLVNQALIKVVDQSGLLLGVTPGWVLAEQRRSPLVAPFHELDLLAAIAIRADTLSFTIGWRRSYTGAGVIDGLVLSGGI